MELPPLKAELLAKQKALKDGQNVIFLGADRFTASGYVQYPRFLFFDPRLTDADRSCYALLLYKARGVKATWPGQQGIADLWGCSVEKVARCMKRLAACGFIETIRQYSSKADIIVFPLSISELLSRGAILPAHLTHLEDTRQDLFVRNDQLDAISRLGWIEIPLALYLDHDLNDRDRTIYAALLSASRDGGISATTYQRTIAVKLNIDERTIQRAVKSLRDKHYLDANRAGIGKSNRYSLNLRVKKTKDAA